MPTRQKFKAIYRGSHEFMLKSLQLIKATDPDSYEVVARFAEDLRQYNVAASGLEDLKPIPKD